MKNCLILFAIGLLTMTLSIRSLAQDKAGAGDLVREGKQLVELKNYPGAAEKFKQAIKIDSANMFVNYQLALALFNAGKGTEGLLYLQNVIDSKNPSLTPAAYDLQSLIYFKNKQYAEAENSAIETVKLSPENAGAQRTYALVCFHQNKRAAALLGFCSFILLEPNTGRSAQAYENIKQIIQGGSLKPEPGQPTSRALDGNATALNQAITLAVAKAAKEKHATGADVLTAQLTNVFNSIGQLADKQSGDNFFRNYMAAFFYKMAQSPYMPVMTHLVSGSTKESKRWLNENSKQVDDLHKWVAATQREI